MISLSVNLVELMTVTHHVSLLIKFVTVFWTVLEEKMNQMTAVLMEMFAWWVAAHHLKEEWSTVGIEYGELYVMTSGITVMLLLCADNWDTPLKVNTSTFLWKRECYYSVLYSLQMPVVFAVLGMVKVMLAN